ncbi:MAG: ABC transporter ATP-binding protein [Nitrososphaeria archaeon]|nr:ABC transporter ATP-binding protein [Nitrososphaeria archaeon]
MAETLLKVEDLNVEYVLREYKVNAVRNVSFYINEGECIALVGESGSGKSTVAMAVMGLLPPYAKISAKKITFDGKDILNADERLMTEIRGKDVTVIFQDPISYLNPIISVGEQIFEALMAHNPKISSNEAHAQAIELLKKVRIADPERVLKMYPFQLSGGMAQRVFIAMAISAKPKLLIADEPTTALDLTIQSQILKLLNNLRKEYNLSIILITHDLSLTSYLADRIYVMYNGQVVEEDSVEGIFSNPIHPYTKTLILSSQAIYLGEVKRLREKMATITEKVENSYTIKGCDFIRKCSNYSLECEKEPPLIECNGLKKVRCWRI